MSCYGVVLNLCAFSDSLNLELQGEYTDELLEIDVLLSLLKI